MIKNVAFSLLSFGTTIVVSFFLSPFILRQLGDERYGIWALFGEVLSYYSLLDFGVRGALSYYAGKALAVQKGYDLRRYASTAFFGLAGISSLVLLASTGAVYFFQDIFTTSELRGPEVMASASFFLFIFCLSLPLEIFGAILVGNRKQYLVSSSEIGARMLSTCLMFALLSWRPSLLAICFTQLIGKSMYWILLVRYVRKHVPETRISLKDFSRSTLRALATYGGQNAFINVSWLLVNRKDVVLTTIFWGPGVVPFYSFARILVQKIAFACSSVAQPLRPDMVHHWERNEKDRAREIYYTGARYSAFVACMLAAFLFAFGSDFLRLWIGERFVSGRTILRADYVLYVLLIGHLPRLMHSVSWQLLFASGRQKDLTIMLACEALVNTLLSVILIRPFGMVGLGLATMIPMLISNSVVLPMIMKRQVGTSIRRYVVDGVGRPILAAMVVLVVGLLMKARFPVHDWTGFFASGISLGIFALLLGIVFISRPDERAHIMQKVLNWKRSTALAQNAGD